MFPYSLSQNLEVIFVFSIISIPGDSASDFLDTCMKMLIGSVTYLKQHL